MRDRLLLIYIKDSSDGNDFVALIIKTPMKKIKVLVILISIFPLVTVAQTGHKISEKENIQRSQIMLINQMDQRKIYHWDNGQRSTPMGRQAGDEKITFVKVIGDSAVVLKGYNKNELRNSIVSGKRRRY